MFLIANVVVTPGKATHRRAGRSVISGRRGPRDRPPRYPKGPLARRCRLTAPASSSDRSRRRRRSETRPAALGTLGSDWCRASTRI
jgi:hypothetical protein